MTKPPRQQSQIAVAAWARLIRVSQNVLDRVEADLKAAGFPPLAYYDALLELRRAGANGLRPFQLQQEMLLAQYSTSRLVERLVKAGHVKRTPSKEDGRGQVLKITPAGRKLLQEMWPPYRAAIEVHFAHRLSDREASELHRILGRLRD